MSFSFAGFVDRLLDQNSTTYFGYVVYRLEMPSGDAGIHTGLRIGTRTPDLGRTPDRGGISWSLLSIVSAKGKRGEVWGGTGMMLRRIGDDGASDAAKKVRHASFTGSSGSIGKNLEKD